MKPKLTPKKLELYEFIAKLLYEEWNPIGVDGLPEDEYDSYVSGIFYMAINGSDAKDIEEHLLSIETEQMGLAGDRQICLNIADRIVNKRNEIL